MSALIAFLVMLSPVNFGGTWFVGEHNDEPFDAVPPQTINVIMEPDGGERDRCDWMGGVMIGKIVCGKVDF